VRRKAGAIVPLEQAILFAAINLLNAGEKEFYGYQLARHLAAVADQRMSTAYGTLYRALGRLEAMGLLQSSWEEPQRAADENRPGRRLYALTDIGAERARAERMARHPVRQRIRGKRILPA
jgi:DNA-binding PadR family transcriptional regulator